MVPCQVQCQKILGKTLLTILTERRAGSSFELAMQCILNFIEAYSFLKTNRQFHDAQFNVLRAELGYGSSVDSSVNDDSYGRSVGILPQICTCMYELLSFSCPNSLWR